MKKLFLIPLLFCALPAFAQNCSPFMGIGAVQFTDNLGTPLTNGALYVYQSGTSTPAPSYSDSGCSQLNTNPVTFTTGGRAQIWINTGSFFKYVLCQVSTDGPACSAGDQLFSIDNVPGGATGGGGGGAPFISSSANPATTGVLRCASGDQCLAFRNQANSANLAFTKDSSDLLSWAGGSFKLPEVAAPTCVVGFDIIWADSTAHRLKQCNNGGIAQTVVMGGPGPSDITANDQVTQWHFGGTATPLSGTAPTTGQVLQWNGTNVIGVGPVALQVAVADQTAQSANIGSTTLYAVPSSGAGSYLASCYTVVTQAATTSSTLPICNVGWTDKDTSVVDSDGITFTNNSNTVGAAFPGSTTIIQAKASTNITYSTSGYTSSGATSMQYAVHLKLLFVGP